MPRGVPSGSFDDCLRALGHGRRREVVTTLSDADAPLSVRALAGGDEQCRLALVHNHLPMMSDGGIVEYERDQEIVELRDQATDILPYLDLAADADISGEVS